MMDLEKLLIGDLLATDQVSVTCQKCGDQLMLSGDQMSRLFRPYRSLDEAGASHICGRCHHRGAKASLVV